MGVDIDTVHGTGAGGEVTADDVRKAAPEQDTRGGGVREVRTLRGVAKAMAAAVEKSWSVPQFVQTVLLDATELVRRKQAMAEPITYTDLLVDSVVRAVADVPEVNVSLHPDGLYVYDAVNVSVAVSTTHGLLLPVLRNAQDMSLHDRRVALSQLVERAHSGSLTPDESADGTITVSNLGMHGVETGVPLLTYPQAVLVFAGSLADRPMVVAGELCARPSMYLSIAYDHRVIDGALAARFTAAVTGRLGAAEGAGT